MDGVLVIDKPAGPTSHDVVACVRRALGVGRVGHTGTLDPMATGVLALVLGRATRLAQFLAADDKAYDADIRLGFATDTYDALGTPVARDVPRQGAAPLPDLARIEDALGTFTGTYEQVPPPFSAKKIDGVRAYALAREGRSVAPAAVRVTVHDLRVLALDGPVVRLAITCSAGFYVRSLADALGTRLGVGAHLAALRRTRSGEFGLDEAIPLAMLETDPAGARARLQPIDGLLGTLPPVTLTPEGARLAAHGNEVGPAHLVSSLSLTPPGGRCRLLDQEGRLLGVATAGSRPGLLHPAVVVV